MQIGWKAIGIYTVVIAALAIGATKRLWPSIETQVKVEEKEVIKKDVRTIIKERTNTDGSSTKETIIVDNSKESSIKKFEQITVKKHDWFVAAGAEARLDEINNPAYKLEVNRRIVGDLFLGATVNTKGSFGVQVGITF